MAHPAPAAPFTADLTGRQLGRYEVLVLLASGGMATVYIARRGGVAGFERLVAIKVLHPHLAHDEEFISMFLDEARLAARIRHPNVVATLDISDTQGDGYFLVMDYVEGDHFGHLLRAAARGGARLPIPVTARIVMDALAGLQAAHELTDSSGEPLELVHRDLSPHNLLVGGDGVARITDFGVAKAQVRLSSTRDGQFKGKLSYMAPEQAASGRADQRSDLFSLGIVLWEALTGRRLFRGENNADVLNKILDPKVPVLSQLDQALAPFDAVMATALAKEPDDRFQSAEDFLEAVEEAAGQCGGVATSRVVGREVRKWLGEKIEHEKTRISDAIDALGHSELVPGVLPRPVESGSHSQPTSPSQVQPIVGEAMTLGAKPSTLITDQKPNRKPLFLGAALVVIFLIGGGLGAWALLAGETETEATPESEPRAHLETTAPPAEPPVDPPLETPETEAEAETETETETEVEESASPGRGRRGRRPRGHRTRTETQAQEPATSGRSGDDDEDDLILNPYRR